MPELRFSCQLNLNFIIPIVEKVYIEAENEAGDHEDVKNEHEDMGGACEDMDDEHEEEEGTHMIYLVFLANY